MVGIILRNIISNAIKFSKKGGNISLSSLKTNKLIKISIKDGGVGIPANQLSALFTTGMKSTKGTNNESGTGLGLLLCKEMLERNGGSISIESEFEVGTIVSFELPASQ
jgi:signal transduction histidine kinase